jgi:hypothetical protein
MGFSSGFGYKVHAWILCAKTPIIHDDEDRLP